MTYVPRILLLAPALLIAGSSFLGCSEKSIPPTTEMSDKDLQQIKELNEQRVDEWGNKVK